MTDRGQLAATIDAAARIPLAIRLSHEIPKPLDWQDFQRFSVILFREELCDPHVQEYGRNGQEQHGIDIRGYRNCDPENEIGIQCRRYSSPLKYKAMLDDCRKALAHFPKIREFIFATTSPSDAKATDQVDRVQKTLREEGRELRVILYGWDHLQQLIAKHPPAYAVFYPYAQSTSIPQSLTQATVQNQDMLTTAMAEALRQMLRPDLLNTVPSTEPSNVDRASEDPALHARIDVYRDMFAKDWLVAQAERGLLELSKTPGLDQKPWAKFRIESNLASISFGCGRETEAITRFEEAHKLLPHDATAKANLALARTMQGRFEDAIQLAHDALTTIPRSDQAVSYLLQAAARSDWHGDPETLIPPDLVGSVHADLGLAEFYRRRDMPGWQQQSIEIANRHPDVAEFRPIHAIAVLSLAIDSGLVIAGGLGPVSSADVTAAADEAKVWIERMLDLGVGGKHDQGAHLNNACVLLRLCDRHAEAEQLLLRAGTLVDCDPLLRRLLAITQLSLGRREDAIKNLSGDTDPENVLFHAELIAQENLGAALAQALAVDADQLTDRLKSNRSQMIAELAFRLNRQPEFDQAIAELHALEPDEPFADLIELRAEKQKGLTEEEYRQALVEMAQGLSDRASIMGRTLLATELQDANCSGEASFLLEGRVDLSRVTPTSIFYLHTLAASRRDQAFETALSNSSEALRDHPEILWFRSAHAWNIGDLNLALQTVTQLTEFQPQNAQARIFKIEVLLRQNKSPNLLAELEQPLEQLPHLTFQNSLRLALLLRQFGFQERAANFAYKLFLENQESPRAWMALMNMVFADAGRSGAKSCWDVSTIGPDVAVDLRFDDGQTRFFVVEADQQLRKLDSKSWEPDHALVKAVAGLPNGARFQDGAGRSGTITNLRHKIVARFHYVLEHYEARFPGRNDLRSINIDPNQSGGLDELKAQLKEHADWIHQEQEQWQNGQWPLSLLAMRLHMDIIDVALGLASQGMKLKVAEGNQPEKEFALSAIGNNQQKGCVLDLHSFWTSWRLQTLGAIEAMGGRIHVCQGVIDRLRARQERLQTSAHDGQKSAYLVGDQLALSEISANVIQESVDDIDRAIMWLETNAEVCPVIVADEFPSLLRDHMTIGRSDIYDALTLAMQKDLLLVTDDLPTRVHGLAFGFQRSCWTQVILRQALDARRITLALFVRAVAHLIEAGHNYIGASGLELACALRIDIENGGPVPGKLFDCLSDTIGGKHADPVSHASAVVAFLLIVKGNVKTSAYWKKSASILVLKLLRERHDDYIQILRAVITGTRGNRDVVDFLLYWATGHFIPQEKLLRWPNN